MSYPISSLGKEGGICITTGYTLLITQCVCAGEEGGVVKRGGSGEGEEGGRKE